MAVENHAVGSDWGDYDNDGDLDLSVISYVGAPGAQTPLNALFRNDGAKGFVNVLTKDSPLNKADHASQFVDYDNDGGIDLSITDGYGPVGGHFVFRNTLPADGQEAQPQRDACSTPRAITRGSAPRCGCSTAPGGSSPRARW